MDALAAEHVRESFQSIPQGKEALADLNESHWESVLEGCLSAMGETETSAKRSADWKLAIATKMKSGTSDRLGMGSPRSASSNCSVHAKKKEKCPRFRKLRYVNFDV